MDYNFACDKCPRTFKLEEFFRKHQRVHELKKQHKCHICGFVYGAAKGLEGHLKTHEDSNKSNDNKGTLTNGSSDVASPPIDYLFLNAQGVLSSQKVEEPVKVSKDRERQEVRVKAASEGSNVNKDIGQVVGYGNSSNGGTGVYKIYASVPDVTESNCLRDASNHYVCLICGRSFTGLNSLRKHMPIHTRSVQHACHVCGHVFGKRDYLVDHIKAQHGSWVENNVANINELNRILNAPNANILPPNIQLPNEPLKTLSCHLCVDKFVLKSELHAHLESAHRLPILSCASCGDKFADILELQDHITKMHSEVAKSDATVPKSKESPVKPRSRRPGPASRTRVSLPNTTSTSMSSTSVTSQKRISHHELYGGPKFSASEVVERVLAEAKATRGSKKSNVTGNSLGSSVVCSVCDQAFPNPSSLRNHVVNVHVNQQQHTCDLCGKAFLSQINLDDHVKTKHPNMKKKLQSLARGLTTSDEAATTISPSIAVSPLTSSTKSSCLSPKADSSTSLSISTSSLSSALSTTNHSDLSNKNDSSSLLILSAKRASIINNNNNEIMEEEKGSNENVVVDKDEDADDVCSDLSAPQESNTKTSTGSSSSLSTLGSLSGRKRHSVCKICGVVLSPKTNVNVHMRTHSGARPYECVLCLNRFRQKAHLMKHFRCSHHQKRPPFVCQFCGLHAASSNDLYRHIADNHQRETQQLTRKIRAQQQQEQEEQQMQFDAVEDQNQEHDAEEDAEPVMKSDDPEMDTTTNSDKTDMDTETNLATVTKDNSQDNDDLDHCTVEDDVRYEAIMEAFLFEEQVIHPCYVVLPFVDEQQVQEATKSDASIESDDSGDEGRLTIDEDLDLTTNVDKESESDPKLQEFDWRLERPGPKSAKIAAAERRRLNADMAKLGMLSKAEARKRPAPTSSLDDELSRSSGEHAVYPKHAVLDFGLPFTLTNLWRKKADELSPQMMQQLELWKKMEEIRAINEDARQDYHNNNNNTKDESPRRRPRDKKRRKASDESNAGSHRSSRTNSSNDDTADLNNEDDVDAEEGNQDGETSTVVSAYESEIQNDRWPVRCIKCSIKIKDLDAFNVHMNEHWSEDKCCPVCGLLINSKRFNFKQHLKIHTGEKPFVCSICNRSFRQKAHMVKHVTTHRTIINGNGAISNANPATVSVK